MGRVVKRAIERTWHNAAPPPAQLGPAQAGQIVAGRFRLESPLGEGATGEVWLARDLSLGVAVALKMSLPSKAPDEALSRVRNEARITARLSARHTLSILDYGVTPDGRAYIAMEYVDGETLEARLDREGALHPDAAVAILTQAGATLARAHAMGIVHRDFKPTNVMLSFDEAGQRDVRVIDFSVACLAPWAPAEEGSGLEPARPGEVVGSPFYMAPEQTRGEVVSEACDQWAFGVVAYEALTGVLPFSASHVEALFERIRAGEPTAPSRVRPSLPPALDEWIRVVLHVDPDRRFRNMQACVEAFRAALADPVESVPPSARLATTWPPATQPWAASLLPVAPRSRARRGLVVAAGVAASCAVLAALLGARLETPSVAAEAEPVRVTAAIPDLPPPPALPAIVMAPAAETFGAEPKSETPEPARAPARGERGLASVARAGLVEGRLPRTATRFTIDAASLGLPPSPVAAAASTGVPSAPFASSESGAPSAEAAVSPEDLPGYRDLPY